MATMNQNPQELQDEGMMVGFWSWQNAGVISLLIILTLSFIVSVVANTLSILILIKRTRLHSIANRFVINMAASSCTCSLLLCPLLAVDMIASTSTTTIWSSSQSVTSSPAAFLLADSCSRPVLLDAVCMWCVMCSTTATLLVTGDRYCAVTGALRYRAVMTSRRATAALLVAWTVTVMVDAVSVATAVGRCYSSDENHVLSWVMFVEWAMASVEFAIPFTALVWMYVRIYQCAHNSGKKQRQNSATLPLNNYSQGLALSITAAPARAGIKVTRSQSMKTPACTSGRPAPMRRSTSTFLATSIKRTLSSASEIAYHEEARTARVSLSVVGASLLCWSPYLIERLVSLALPQKQHVRHAVAVLLAVHMAVTPFLYTLRSGRGRRELRQLFAVFTTRTHQQHQQEQRKSMWCPRKLLNRLIPRKITSSPNSSVNNIDDGPAIVTGAGNLTFTKVRDPVHEMEQHHKQVVCGVHRPYVASSDDYCQTSHLHVLHLAADMV